MITLDQQISAVKREIHFREQVYPRRVADGKITRKFADFQLEAMRAVLATLERLAETERLL